MNPKQFMLIAGEASGDLLAAELVFALREKIPSSTFNPPSPPVFFGAGGPRMAAAGVELAFDMTQHSVIGISDVLKNYFKFRRLFNQLLKLAIERKPDIVIGVDYGGFNLRFGHAIKEYVRNNPFLKWNPKIVQFVSPQVWASRPGRANLLAADYDLLLSIFPFEKDWYAQRVPKLRVEFVGHPMVGRFTNDDLRFTRRESEASRSRGDEAQTKEKLEAPHVVSCKSRILLLPGSRADELRRHLPPMLGALKLIREKLPSAKVKMVLPDEALKQLADKLSALPSDTEIQIGNLPQALAPADVVIASTGTVTMECAFFGVPTVTLYKTSWSTYQIGRRIVKVKWLTMPNILADEEVFPEFVQGAATPDHIAGAALELLQNEPRRIQIKKRLAEVVSSLGGPGANTRAATAILSLFN
ncbi:MAG: lipid-A-disaccharide synthase [Verrucomicrobiota bacterium]|jgi:lipid-A-disaccharide synthase